MRLKVERLAESITGVVSTWASVECIALAEHAETDILDPYFALVLDVYHRGPIPSMEERHSSFAAALGDPGAFESSSAQTKDRFFIDGLPVRIEYKSASFIEELLDRGLELAWAIQSSGTYMYYRFLHAKILFRRSSWIDDIRAKLHAIPVEWWRGLREIFQSKMEHSLSDLGAAAVSDDGYFYMASAAAFARYAAATVFMVNRRFEPSPRAIDSQVRALKRLPESFVGWWDTFLQTDKDFNRRQKYEVAQLIARCIIALPQFP